MQRHGAAAESVLRRAWRSRGVPLLGFVGLAAALWVVFLRPVRPDDLAAFLAGAQRAAAGHDPYRAAHSVAFSTGHAFVYPFLVAWLFEPLAALPSPASHLVFALLSMGAIGLACRLVRPSRPLVGAALVLTCSATVISLQMGTLNALLLLGLAAAWAYRDRPWVSGTALGLAAVAKLFLAPALVWMFFSRRYRAAAVGAGVFASVLGAGFATGPLGARGYFSMLARLSNNESSHGWSLAALFRALGLSPTLTHLLAVGAGGVVLLACWLRTRRGGDERVMFAGSVAASLLACPIVWASYLPLLLVPLLVVADDATLVAAIAVGWAVVVPDRAGPAQIVAGLCFAGVASAVALAPQWEAWRRRRPLDVRGMLCARWRVIAVLACGIAMIAAVLEMAPAHVASPLPALLCCAGALAYPWWRSPRTSPAGAPGLPRDHPGEVARGDDPIDGLCGG